MPLPITDTRSRFRPLCRDIGALLRGLQLDDWERATLAGSWRVRHVVAHLCDTALRRLSLHRDRRMPPPGPRGTSEQDLTLFVNDLNATWIRAAERFSPRVLADLYAHASDGLAAFIETLDPHAGAVLPVSWAGQAASPQWLDIGREFTEVWHHGSQIREAVGAGPFRARPASCLARRAAAGRRRVRGHRGDGSRTGDVDAAARRSRLGYR